MNKSGGMTVMWNKEVKVLVVLTTAFTMEVHIMDTEINVDSWFIGIYASTDDQIRRNQWKNGLIDLGFEGNPWTWSNHWNQEGEIKQRLDRALGSSDWSQQFDRANVKHIENFGSDHSMLLLDSNPLKERRKKRIAILKWRNNFQANARKNIEKVKKQLEELKNSDCQDKMGRNKMLKMQLKEAYDEEETFWNQKSRVQWLKEGDRNTLFFTQV
ncbi:uncharacterized protein [Coffea arabica]|uniref:Uncharacterized protein n=1 Tax=Coffea arabica TaxID=13443 RepID=A0A6P6TWT9_COFAR|nr:uncharacterized protein LOC113704500 [Coffea arabica]